MANTITLRKAIERAEKNIIVDGAVYELADVGFEESEMDTILEVVKDGIITPEETGKIKEITAALEQIQITAQEMKIWVSKNLKGGSK